MSIFQAIILGIVQGLTEFLPVSSSGHLVIVPFLLGWEFPAEQVFPFDILVQLGTLVGVIVYFFKDILQLITGFFSALVRKDWENDQFRLGIHLVLATIPAGVAGLTIRGLVERVFHQPGVTGIFLLVTAGLLFTAERVARHEKELRAASWLDALLIGLGQALAVFPGVSRSGATISTAMLRRFKRDDAARFSFLMSIPIMLLAGGYSLWDMGSLTDLGAFVPVLAAGFVAAALVGYISIFWLLRYLRTRSFYPFAWYCLGLGILTIVLFYA